MTGDKRESTTNSCEACARQKNLGAWILLVMRREVPAVNSELLRYPQWAVSAFTRLPKFLDHYLLTRLSLACLGNVLSFPLGPCLGTRCTARAPWGFCLSQLQNPVSSLLSRLRKDLHWSVLLSSGCLQMPRSPANPGFMGSMDDG